MTPTAAATSPPDGRGTTFLTKPRLAVALTDRYEKQAGLTYLTGLQALVRLPVEQARRDRQRGRDVRTLISGYEGSPLAGYDLELARNSSLMDAHGIVVLPHVNEELAANAVQGSQLASVHGKPTSDGVVGIWYGKAPGLDRASDALRHANLGGASTTGGVLVLVGDDAIAKSSTVPSSSEAAMAEIGMTVLSPCDAQDILELGLHGIALSRFCGLWTGMKLATNVVDGGMTVDLDETRAEPTLPDNAVDGRPYAHEVSSRFFQPHLSGLERSAFGARPALALRYARVNGLNRIEGDPGARIGFVAHGTTYLDTVRALGRMGVDPRGPGSGVRVLKLGMVSPLDPEIVREFAAGLDEIVVVEEKRAFVELAVKDVLYDVPGAPAVHGRRGPDGRPLLRREADLPPESIAAAVAPRLAEHLTGFVVPQDEPAPAAPRRRLPLLPRLPYFCSGCPHNSSTQAPAGSLVGAGIGCSGLTSYMDEDRVGRSLGLCQMGGEGAAWTGMAPFVEENHVFQNIGDGTFHHSGSLAVRSAVAAGVDMTYKLLHNGAVAMTGGQQAVGRMSVPEIVQELLAEGVARVVITTDQPDTYRRVRLPTAVEVRHRSRLIETQEELARIKGVTVLIHDQECATELRRKRKRKLVAEPTTRAYINERVCEGCGDCGEKSNCLSVQPVTTDYGRKTRIHQASCNKDYSCLDGDCPSFITVEPGGATPGREFAPLAADSLPDPVLRVRRDGFGLRLTGIGGTGVVTTSQVLATAAVIDGFHARGLDQLGLAQKGGAVVSDLVLTEGPDRRPAKVGAGECDLYLGADILVAAADANLAAMAPDRTIAVLSTAEVPTGSMVSHVGVSFPPTADTAGAISVRARETFGRDARQLCRDLFDDDQYANILLIGMAVQAGALPIRPASVEDAIRLNGVAVERNLEAFRRGRQVVADPEGLAAATAPEATVALPGERAVVLAATAGLPPGSLGDLVTRRVDDLIGYQGTAYARRYADAVAGVRDAEEKALGAPGSITEGFAHHLHKLMAYKDEYEVARLSLDPLVLEGIRREFGADARWSYQLHPPVLRALGMKRKLRLGPWFMPAFRVLRALRVLRGTAADPFGWARVRRTERALVDEYLEAVGWAMGRLTPATAGDVEALVRLPDQVRGYEEIKLASVECYRSDLAELRRRL